MARYFRIEEAQRLIPQVRDTLQNAISLRRLYAEAELALRNTLNWISMSGGALVDRDAVSAQRARREECAANYNAAIERIHSLGCQIKDLEQGLVDFPTLFEGREVLLCWKLGEERIEWWHGLEDGFAGRKPIDRHFLERHEGGGASS